MWGSQMLVCAKRLLTSPACLACGARGEAGPFCAPCAGALAEPAAGSAEAAIYRYGGPLADAIRRAKFGGGAGGGGCERTARQLARLGSPIAREGRAEADAITWVPSSPRRARRRGFELPALLAREWGHELQLPARSALVCARDDPPLSSGAGAAERAQLVAGRFRARDVAARRWLLVDDVVTTGATLREAARTLRAAGAAEVTCLALAATPKD